MKLIALILCGFFAAHPLALGQLDNGQRVDVGYGMKTNLQQFGGPNVDIVIYNKQLQPERVSYGIMDNEHQVASAHTTITDVVVNRDNTASVSGRSAVVFNPMTTQKFALLGIGEGVEIRAQGYRKAYLLHEIPDGPKIYFLDALDTGVTECALWIVPKPTPTPTK